MPTNASVIALVIYQEWFLLINSINVDSLFTEHFFGTAILASPSIFQINNTLFTNFSKYSTIIIFLSILITQKIITYESFWVIETADIIRGICLITGNISIINDLIRVFLIQYCYCIKGSWKTYLPWVEIISKQ